MSKNWWKDDDGVSRYQLGTIVLKSFVSPYSCYVQQFGTTYATLLKLANHHKDHNISPDQYTWVEKPTLIRRFAPIKCQVYRVILQQVLANGFQYKGQPVCYRNVRKNDLSDDADLEVDIVWQLSEKNLYNLFEAARFLHVPNVGLTFAAYLLRQFFPTSLPSICQLTFDPIMLLAWSIGLGLKS